MAQRTRGGGERGQRRRYDKGPGVKVRREFTFVNPWPWMPGTDARVQLKLLQLQVPFSYRYFNSELDILTDLLPGWQPEFTLRDYKTVIVVIGAFFGGIPSVVAENQLARVVLEGQGWRWVELQQGDIERDLDGALKGKIPGLAKGKRGLPYINPYAAEVKTQMDAYRAMSAASPRRRSARHLVRGSTNDGSARGRRTRGVRLNTIRVGSRARDLRLEYGGDRFSKRKTRRSARIT